MKNTYHDAKQGLEDKMALNVLLDLLDAPLSAVGRDECGLWVIQGSRGYISTWGDGETWHLAVNEVHSPVKWTWTKKRLAFCEVTQDGDQEGCFRLGKLSNPVEAQVIRDVIGLRKRNSPNQWAHLQRWAFQGTAENRDE